MTKILSTLGIYGIQDCNSSNIPTISHDHGMAFLNNGSILKHIQLERLNRHKYSNKLQENLLSILKNESLLKQDYDLIFTDNILGRSFINSEGNLRFEAPITKKLSSDIEEGQCFWLDKERKAYIINHELAHIASCLPFYGNFKNNSLLIHYDGGASKSNFSAWHYIDNKLKLITADWDLKKVTSIFNANALMFGIIGAKPKDLNSVPGKLMGFSSFGKPDVQTEEWLIENNFFENEWKNKKHFFDEVKTKYSKDLKHLSQHDSFIQDIAATAHEYFIKESLSKIKEIQSNINADNLYYSGGTALSIVLNTRLVESNIFKNIFIPPCCSDSGLALGAAAFMEWKKGNRIKQHSPYLNNTGLNEQSISDTDHQIKETARLLKEGKVIGICNGFGEIGPRALGNRSILCLANDKKLAEKVSIDIKKREWYRPVAPIMLEKNARYFTERDSINELAKYMLLEFEIPENKRKELSGAIHIDNTARVQTISNMESNPYIYKLLTELDNNYNIKALINTSFNSAGEPIVHTEEDAMKSAKKMKLDGVVLNGELHVL